MPILRQVIEDIIYPIENTATIRVLYGEREVITGASLKQKEAANQPCVRIEGSDARSLYTLVVVDPDAPTPTNPTQKEYLLWLVTDIPGSTDASYGNEIVAYESPKTAVGIHRIVFVVFRQKMQQNIYAPGWRQNFITKDFTAIYDLGSPATASCFHCQREKGCGGRRF